MRLYIANFVFANKALSLTQLHLRDIAPRQGTTGIIRHGQLANTLGAHDERKRKINDRKEDIV